MPCRDGEEEKIRFRSERFFTSGNMYYFSTREGPDLGPFPNRKAAEDALRRYIECMKQGGNVVKARQVATQGEWASNHFR